MLMNLKNFTLRSERLLVIALLACSTPHAFTPVRDKKVP